MSIYSSSGTCLTLVASWSLLTVNRFVFCSSNKLDMLFMTACVDAVGMLPSRVWVEYITSPLPLNLAVTLAFRTCLSYPRSNGVLQRATYGFATKVITIGMHLGLVCWVLVLICNSNCVHVHVYSPNSPTTSLKKHSFVSCRAYSHRYLRSQSLHKYSFRYRKHNHRDNFPFHHKPSYLTRPFSANSHSPIPIHRVLSPLLR